MIIQVCHLKKRDIEQCCVSYAFTDGEKGFNTLNEEIQVKADVIDFSLIIEY